MLVLKRTSKLGRAQVARTGTAIVGNRMQEPRSDRDRAGDADLTGPGKGDLVRVVSGPHKGCIGTVVWAGAGSYGGPRLGIGAPGREPFYVGADDVVPALAPRFQREPGR